jgi:hypothetical protein
LSCGLETEQSNRREFFEVDVGRIPGRRIGAIDDSALDESCGDNYAYSLQKKREENGPPQPRAADEFV